MSHIYLDIQFIFMKWTIKDLDIQFGFLKWAIQDLDSQFGYFRMAIKDLNYYFVFVFKIRCFNACSTHVFRISHAFISHLLCPAPQYY